LKVDRLPFCVESVSRLKLLNKLVAPFLRLQTDCESTSKTLPELFFKKGKEGVFWLSREEGSNDGSLGGILRSWQTYSNIEF
jgi:hypothetical protein